MGSIETPNTGHIDFERSYGNIINGVSSSTKAVRHGVNPATGKALYDVPLSGQEEVDLAVQSARAAFAKWSKIPLKDRQDAVLRFADALEREKAGFAKLLTLEVGKPVWMIILSLSLSPLLCVLFVLPVISMN